MEDEMSKHMFGPLNPALGGGRVFIEDGDGEDVAEMLFEHDQVKMRAYTSLFCAAPDLLAACKAAERIEQLRDEIGSCHARINAQRTETAESVTLAKRNLEAYRAELRTIRQSLRAAIAKAEGGAA